MTLSVFFTGCKGGDEKVSPMGRPSSLKESRSVHGGFCSDGMIALAEGATIVPRSTTTHGSQGGTIQVVSSSK